MKNAINARAAEAKETMTRVMVAYNVGIVVISKANLIPNRMGKDERGGWEGRGAGGVQ
jgi:hypothetical protein